MIRQCHQSSAGERLPSRLPGPWLGERTIESSTVANGGCGWLVHSRPPCMLVDPDLASAASGIRGRKWLCGVVGDGSAALTPRA